VLDKFGSREEARAFFTDRVRSGHAVPPGNYSEFRELTGGGGLGCYYGGRGGGCVCVCVLL
jgi:hypothetical protein